MVWSNWRGAVVVMLAWVGLAWSQAPMPTSSVGTDERIMTVHENGKSLRCRIVSTWRTEVGSKAYKLQTLDSGEFLTLVEDGPATTLQEPLLAGKAKALPMRIFHWGSHREAPPGVPMAPQTIITAGATTGEKNCGCNQCQAGPAPVATRPIGKDQLIWWEEKNGQRVSPVIVTGGRNPFEQQPAVTTVSGTPITSRGPVIIDQGSSSPNVQIVTTTPGSQTVISGGPVPVITVPGTGEAPRMATSAPVIRTVVHADPGVPVTSFPVVESTEKSPRFWQKLFPGPKVTASQADQMINATQPSFGKPATTIPYTKPQGPYVQTGPTLLPNKASQAPFSQAVNYAKPQGSMTQTNPANPLPNAPLAQATPTPAAIPAAPSSPNQPANAKEPMPTTAAAASSTKPTPTVAQAPRPTVFDKINNWLHPKRETTVVKPAEPKPAEPKPPEPKQVAGSEKPKDNVAKVDTPKAAGDVVPFSTATDPGGKVKSLPPRASSNTQTVGTGNLPSPQAVSSGGAAPAQDKVDDTKPLVQATPRKDWRMMWGQPKDTKVQVPGQSIVEQASAKPDPNSIPLLQNAAGMPANLPPTSKIENKSVDILLNPEKFDPAGARLTPKGINMNSFRGDPAQLMTMGQAPAGEPNMAQNGLPPLPPTGFQPPPLPAYSGQQPLGSQSVLAAGSNAPTRMTYVPVPIATVPDPYRPPGPPAPRLPEPPQPNAYVNAFTPAPPPQDVQPPNPMTVNAFSNMNPQPNANQMAQRYPQAPANYQPNPMAQGYPMAPGYPPNPNMMMAQGMPNPYYYGPQGPMPQQPMMSPQGHPLAQVNYPQQYQGPQPPNPNFPQVQQPVQPVQYSPVPTQQPTVNMAMDRRQLPGAVAPSTELIQVLQVLRESPYPAQREWASNTLGTYDWRAHPEVVQVLLQVAQQDPAATVRASCVYSLGHMNAASEPVISTLCALRNDGDPRVRQEVEQTLVRLGVNRK